MKTYNYGRFRLRFESNRLEIVCSTSNGQVLMTLTDEEKKWLFMSLFGEYID